MLETKLKGKGEVSWCGINGIIAGFQETERAREGMAILCVGNTYFKYRSLCRYTRVARGQDRVERKSMIDLVLVKRDILRYVQDVRVVRVMG